MINHSPKTRFRTTKLAGVLAGLGGLACVLSIALGSATAVAADARPGDERPYDQKLFRLAEILGAVHYLRELCDAAEGQKWRDQMKGLLSVEGSTALRRARLTRNFNNGYRSYSRTYVNCTPSAKTAISRFLTEGVEISEKLIKSTR